MRRRLGPFGRGPFAAYWAGGTLSNCGTWLQTVAGSVFVYDRTGSVLAVGILNFVTFLPILLFSVGGGVLSDRLDRRVLVVVTHAASVVMSLALAATVLAGVATEVHVMVIGFALQSAYAIAKPSLTAMLPALVPRAELTEAVGLNTLQFLIGQIAGPLLAAVVLATSGPGWAFAINAATYLGPIAAMAYLARAGLGGRETRSAQASAGRPVSVLGYVRSHAWIASVLLGVLCTSGVLEVVRTTAPMLVSQRLAAPTSATGVIFAALSAGSVLGILAFVPLRRRELSRQLAAAGLLVQAAGLGGMGAATTVPAAAVAVAAVGMGFSLCFPVLTGTLQTEVPDPLRGRIMSLHQMVHIGNRPFMALAAGAIAASLGGPAAALAATVLAPIGLVALRTAWRRLGVTAAPEPTLASAG